VSSSAPAGGALWAAPSSPPALHQLLMPPLLTHATPPLCQHHASYIEMELELMKKLCQMVFFRVRSEKTWRRGKWGPKPLKMAREPYQTDPNLGCREAKFISVPQWAPPITPCLRLDQIKLCRSTTPTPHF
jgi:hypothetical protein